MKIIERTIKKDVLSACFQGKVVIIYGPRQVGKTTLAKTLVSDIGKKGLYMTCDDPQTRSELTGRNTAELLRTIQGYEVIVIDEAQRVDNIGITLKQLVDALPQTVQIIATGSSSFDLANKINEPLTGRSREFMLYPLSLEELRSTQSLLEQKSTLMQRVVFGCYPEVVLGTGDHKQALFNLTEHYLYKDLLSYDGIRKPELLEKLIKLLASSVGQLVSYTELANTLDVSKQTIESYITILEQAFIIYTLKPYSKNVRSELTKKRKVYFIDTGILSMVSGDLSPLDHFTRTNTGQIWENFVINERMKSMKNHGNYMARWNFWRTITGQEIDLIETNESRPLHAFEIKWKPEKRDAPSSWKTGYPDSVFTIIHRENFFQEMYEADSKA